ncbi:hypothetical protein CFIMG_007857RA00001 [Ceratocystis fimbriata CBS 114723]|uniref:Uncharacterized protein n=1 Tax=Ceratocystis fimbriata CBS 114723 TaxID=1035309 RepID=A0A2C5WTZ7_9PEZI|nr:hypothetical protein CFIMG_007857RA00001 [Ceratocystis fimbriata CBS 114723]
MGVRASNRASTPDLDLKSQKEYLLHSPSMKDRRINSMTYYSIISDNVVVDVTAHNSSYNLRA